MFIRRFTIRHFKNHKKTELDLFPVTVFVGPNSGGKSAIFDALINFSVACRGSLSEAFSQYPYSFDSLRYHDASKDARIRYQADLVRKPGDADVLLCIINIRPLLKSRTYAPFTPRPTSASPA